MQQKIVTYLMLIAILFSSFGLLVAMPSKVTAQRFQPNSTENKCNGDAKTCLQDNGIVKIINTAIALIAGVAGVAITGMMIAGGIRYSSAGGDPSAVGKAKKMISNAIIALIAFIFLGAFLEWLVPGGLIR